MTRADLRAAAKHFDLSERELMALLLAGHGHKRALIAYRLGVSESCVQYYLRRVFIKTGAVNTVSALFRVGRYC